MVSLPRRAAFVFAAALLVLAAAWAPPQTQEVTAFINASVIPMDRDGVQPNWTVVVRGHRIVGAGPSASVKAPPGAKRINAAGKYLMPGLVDAHVHVSVKDDLFLFVAGGVTTVQGEGGAAQRTQQWAREIAEGKFLGPNYVNCDSIASGFSTVEQSERFMNSGNKPLAIRNYEQSVELNPQNTGGVDALKRLRAPV